MSYRFMRVMVMFDLPVKTTLNRRDYNKFHKYLVKNGFIMMQESVYTKLVLNSTAAAAVVEGVRKNSPGSGLIQLMCVTEKQFSKMEYIIGDSDLEILNSDERLVIF